MNVLSLHQKIEQDVARQIARQDAGRYAWPIVLRAAILPPLFGSRQLRRRETIQRVKQLRKAQ